MLTRRSRLETHEVVETPRQPELSSNREWLKERISGGVAIAVGVSWLVLLTIGAELEPTTNQSEPFVGVLLGVAMTTLFVATLVGLGMRRRWGLVTSLVGGIALTAMSIMCPVSGHHSFGAWWYGQMLCALGLVAISFAALRRDTVR
jgi:hypothetical protein